MSWIKAIFLILFSFSLIACGGGGGGDGSGDKVESASCSYEMPQLSNLNVDLTITNPSIKAPAAGTKLSFWHNGNSGGILQGSRSTGGIWTFDDDSWTYSVNSQDKTAEIWMTNASGEETYYLTAISPTKGTWTSESLLVGDSTSYISTGVFDLPSFIIACMELDTTNSKVSELNKSLSTEDKSFLAESRSIDSWLEFTELSQQGAYAFITNTTDTVLGIFDGGIKVNEVTFETSLIPDFDGFITVYNDYGVDASTGALNNEQYNLESHFFDDTNLIQTPSGGWLFYKYLIYYNIDETGVVSQYNPGFDRFTNQNGTPLSGGKLAVFNDDKFVILDDTFNEVCSSTQTYAEAGPTYGGKTVEGRIRNYYYKSFVEDANGDIYMAITDRDTARIYVTKWDVSCNQLWSSSQSIYTYGAYPNATVFKVAGDYIYLAYQDKYINYGGAGDKSGRVRYTFSRFATSNGQAQIIDQYEARTEHERAYIFDVVEDVNGDLILAHGDTIEKINGEDFESIISYKFDGHQPMVPLNFNADGDLEVNNQFVVDKSLL